MKEEVDQEDTLVKRAFEFNLKSLRFNKASKSIQERDSLSLSLSKKKKKTKKDSSRARRVWSRIVAAANFSGRGGPKLNSQVLQKRVL